MCAVWRSYGTLCKLPSLQKTQENCPDAQTGNGTQQPVQVVAGGTTDGVQRIAQRALQPAAIPVVIQLQVSDGGRHRCRRLSQPF